MATEGASGPRAGPTTVYCGAYRDSGDCGFGLRGAELARCYEVRSASTPPSPLPASALARLAAAGWGLCHVHMLDFLKNGTGISICRWQFS